MYTTHNPIFNTNSTPGGWRCNRTSHRLHCTVTLIPDRRARMHRSEPPWPVQPVRLTPTKRIILSADRSRCRLRLPSRWADQPNRGRTRMASRHRSLPGRLSRNEKELRWCNPQSGASVSSAESARAQVSGEAVLLAVREWLGAIATGGGTRLRLCHSPCQPRSNKTMSYRPLSYILRRVFQGSHMAQLPLAKAARLWHLRHHLPSPSTQG